MAEKKQKREFILEEDLSIACKREDANNGFIDLQKPLATRTDKCDKYEKNTLELQVKNLSTFKVREIIEFDIWAQKALDDEGWEVGTQKFYIRRKIEGDGIAELSLIAIKPEKETEDEESEDVEMKRFSRNTITVPIPQLDKYRVGQLTTLKIYKTNELYEIPKKEETS